MVTIITGDIHQGKTTKILSLCDDRPDLQGFVTVAVFEGGDRIGYDLQLLPGGKQIPFMRLLQDSSSLKGAPTKTLGKYALNLQAISVGGEHIEKLLDQGCRSIVMDELGPLECQGEGFAPWVRAVLDQMADLGTVDLWTAVRNTSLEEFLTVFRITDFKIIQI
jgi:nucleoside-triphosphatase THEP1